jgi:hypothetical protein
MKRAMAAVVFLAMLVVGGFPAWAATASASKIKPTPSAKVIIEDLAKLGLPAHLTIVFTAATDPNHLLGRPNGYLSKASFSDKRVPASDTTSDQKGDVDYGGSVEVFATGNEAKARAAYIESVLKADPMLGTEYDYLSGPVLLRISQYLIPSQAREYQRALAKIKV